MNMKKLNVGLSAVALFAVSLPLAAGNVNAANAPVLTGDYAEDAIQGNAVVSGATSPAVKSQAGVKFTSGDLILAQVPNFDFGGDNTIKTGKIILTKSGSNRAAIIVDNRDTPAANNPDSGAAQGWALSAKISQFSTTGAPAVSIPLTLIKDKVQMKDAIQDTDDSSKYTVGTADAGQFVKMAADADVVLNFGNTANQVATGKRYGYTAVSFNAADSAKLSINSDILSDIRSNADYTANIDWTLAADATNPTR